MTDPIPPLSRRALAQWAPGGDRWRQFAAAYRAFSPDGTAIVPDGHTQRARVGRRMVDVRLGKLAREFERLEDQLDAAQLDQFPKYPFDAAVRPGVSAEGPAGYFLNPRPTHPPVFPGADPVFTDDAVAIRDRDVAPEPAVRAAERQWRRILTGVISFDELETLEAFGLRTIDGVGPTELWLQRGDAMLTDHRRLTGTPVTASTMVHPSGELDFKLGMWLAELQAALDEGRVVADDIERRHPSDVHVDAFISVSRYGRGGVNREQFVDQAPDAIEALTRHHRATGASQVYAEDDLKFGEKGYSLAEWCHGAPRRRHNLSAPQLRALDAIGFVWGPEHATWLATHAKVAAAVERKGLPEPGSDQRHLGRARVGGSSVDLDQWLQRQRNLGGRGRLDPQRRSLLTELGVDVPALNPRPQRSRPMLVSGTGIG